MSARILVIDDTDHLREMIRFTLEFRDYAVDEAENGEVGMSLARKNDYDLVLCDIEMPVMDGVQFVTAFREEIDKKKPILMLTAEENTQMIEAAQQAGATQILFKPFEPMQMLEEVENRLK